MNDNMITEPLVQQDTFQKEEHLSDYIQILGKRKWVIISIFLAIVCGVAFYSYSIIPVYKTTAVINIEKQSFEFVGTETKKISTVDFFQTQSNLITSRSLAAEVLKESHLWDNNVQSVVNPISEAQPSKVKNSNILDDSKKVDWYLSKLAVEPVIGTSLLNISFEGESPEKITQILNTHIDVAMKTSIQMEQLAAETAFNWLEKELAAQKAEVEANRHAIHEYKKTFDIISKGGKEDLQLQELVGINSALINARSERIKYQTIYDQLHSFSLNDNSLLPLPEISNDYMIQKLRTELVNLKSKRYQLDQRLGALHPQMIQIDSAIKKLNKEITIEIDRLKKNVKANLDRALAYEKSIQGSVDTQKKQAMVSDGQGIDYAMLEQKLSSSQKIYDKLLTQSKELSMIMGREIGNIHVVDKAEIPQKPFKPDIFKNMVMAVVISLFLGITMAFFFEYMDNTVKNPEDVLRRLKVPVIGTLPYNKALKKDKTLAIPWNEAQKQIGVMDDSPDPLFGISGHLPQATIERAKDGYSGQVLVVQSATMDEGKTTVLTQLAKTLVDSGLRVLMFDFDLYRPSLHKMFGIENTNGLLNAIDRISSFAIESGSLSECSIDDLFFLLGLRKKNGMLSITNDSQTMIVYFLNGRCVHIQDRKFSKSSRMGSMLLKGNLITEEQLNDALERQKRTNQPLGYILINSGYISREKLKGPLKLQREESLQKLFSWKKGTYSFKSGKANLHKSDIVEFGEDSSPMISALGELEGSLFLENEIMSCVRSGHDENLFLLPAGSGLSMRKPQINVRLTEKLLEILKRHFDIILVDTMPMDTTSGVATLSNLMDGVILVIKAGHLSVKSLNEAISCISDQKIIGAVLNQVKSNQSYYYR
ncbi:MAG: hypothetical protein C0408_02985 [Odoribacter sp.]|nr:hypothetical protein [Odoribacter sp.]MBA4369145.1 hypothetical protein [Desulfobacterium sp.]